MPLPPRTLTSSMVLTAQPAACGQQVTLSEPELPLQVAVAARECLQSQAGRPGAAWPLQLAGGLAILLSSRTADQQRHAALQLAAALLDLAGPSALLAPPSQVRALVLQGPDGKPV